MHDVVVIDKKDEFYKKLQDECSKDIAKRLLAKHCLKQLRHTDVSVYLAAYSLSVYHYNKHGQMFVAMKRAVQFGLKIHNKKYSNKMINRVYKDMRKL